jgi:hypothetical protein
VLVGSLTSTAAIFKGRADKLPSLRLAMLRKQTHAALSAALALGMLSCSSRSDTQNFGTIDAWEASPGKAFDYAGCTEIAADLIVPVRTDNRRVAEALLVSSPIVALFELDVAALIGPESATATKLIAKRVEDLAAERQRVLTTRKGSWSLGDDIRLDKLRALGPSASSLSPYLVRGVVRHEATGSFSVRQCGNAVLVSHLSLGDKLPPASRVPVVVFLSHLPTQVYVGAGMAR